jgi:hypothetical protein
MSTSVSPWSKGELTPGLLAAVGAAIQKTVSGSINKGRLGTHQVMFALDRISVLAENGAMVPLGDGQELTLVHFSAQHERFLWDKGRA